MGRARDEGREVVLATVMRPEGATGVQTHVRTTEAFLQATGNPQHRL